jgi:hypothetical protein
MLAKDKQRSRIVCFRASQEEYDSLHRISVSKGARSISEFARSVVCSENAANGDPLNTPERVALLTDLNHTMSALDRSIQKLIETLETIEK